MENGTADRERSEPKPVDLRASMTPGVSLDHPPYGNSGGRNLPFAVVASSGQDEDYPASELNKGIQGRGWQSSRFCFYPQELILELQWPSRVINMQLLCHEYKGKPLLAEYMKKIPSKVEVFVSLMSPWVQSEKAVGQMKRLGYLSLDPNERSGHQARELKSIHVDAPAAVVRLVLHNCYNNKHNSYNQVGLVALIITGEPLDAHQLAQIRQRGYSPLLQTPRVQVPRDKVVDAALHAVDSFTAARIHRLQQEKIMAVQDEDYDEAKRLKNLIEKLKSLGEQIKQLELQKRAAVEVEDYDAAKSCKLEIERLRQCDGDGQESVSYVSENPVSSSKQSHVSLSHNNYHKLLSHEETFFVKGQNHISETSTESHEEKRSHRMEDDKIANGVDLHARISCNPERVQGDLLKDPSLSGLTALAGERRQGMLPTVLSWWKGKEPMRNSDEELKTAILHPPSIEHQASTSQQKTTALYPPDLEQYASTSQQKTVDLHPAPMVEYASASKQTITGYPPVDQDFTKRDQQIAMLHPHTGSFTQIAQQSATNQPPGQFGGVGQRNSPADPPIDHSAESSHHSNTLDSTVEEFNNSGQQQVSSIPLVDQYAKADPKDGQKNADIRFSVERYSKHAVAVTEPKAAVSQFSSAASIPEPSGSQASHEHDTSVPEPLTDVLRAEVGPLLNILDLYYVECLCSKQWQLRDKALQHVVKMLQSRALTGDPSANLKLLDLIVLRAINDRVPNVYYGSLQLLKEYVMKYSGEVPSREIQHGVGAFVSILLDKLGESNVRIRDAAAEMLTFLASKREVGLALVAHHLLKSPKTQASWRPVLGRLQWLLAAIPIYGLQPSSKTGFMSEALMSFVHQAFNSSNGEVRNTAVKVTTEVYKLMGGTVERYLKGIKPIIREVLMNNFQKYALDTRVMDDCNSLTYEELDNIPIMRKSQKAIYTMYENDSRLVEAPMKKHRDTGLHSMIVEQQERLSNGHDDQHMYSNQATAPIVNSSYGEEGYTEEEALTTLGASDQSLWLDADTEPSYASPNDAAPNNQQDQMQSETDDLADQCLFCGMQDPSFLHGDNLDVHFCQKCPMLVACGNCKQIVEISAMKEHYLYECISGRKYVECLKCSQAIAEVRLTSHLRSKECRHGKHHKSTRCPLCHHTVLPGDAGWREHLLKPPGCSKNPRTKQRA